MTERAKELEVRLGETQELNRDIVLFTPSDMGEVNEYWEITKSEGEIKVDIFESEIKETNLIYNDFMMSVDASELLIRDRVLNVITDTGSAFAISLLDKVLSLELMKDEEQHGDAIFLILKIVDLPMWAQGIQIVEGKSGELEYVDRLADVNDYPKFTYDVKEGDNIQEMICEVKAYTDNNFKTPLVKGVFDGFPNEVAWHVNKFTDTLNKLIKSWNLGKVLDIGYRNDEESRAATIRDIYLDGTHETVMVNIRFEDDEIKASSLQSILENCRIEFKEV